VAAAGILTQPAFAQLKPIPQAGPRAAPGAVPPPAVPPPAQNRPQITVKSKHGAWIISCEKRTIKLRPRNAAAKPKKTTSRGNRGDRAKPPPAQAATSRQVEQCAMIQTLRPPGKRRFGTRAMLLKVKGPKGQIAMLMRLVVPAGVFLRDGIAMQVDGKPIGQFPYTRCYGRLCTSTFPVSDKFLALLKKGKTATIFVYTMPGRSVNMTMNLAGFGKAQAALQPPSF
jgi:invasion protein IalB